MENELIEKRQTPMDMIQMAISGKADLDKIEKLMILQERWEANEAKKSFNAAMAAFKINPPKIDKDRHVGYTTAKGRVGYSHASLGNVTEKITAELSKYGLSASWKVKQNDSVSVTCVITHIQGHSEEVTITANTDNTGAKNEIQAIGSVISYLQRYSILCITGLATFDQDNDGMDAPAVTDKPIDENKIKIIKDLLIKLKVDEKSFLKYMDVEKVEDIPESSYGKAKISLESRRVKK